MRREKPDKLEKSDRPDMAGRVEVRLHAAKHY